MSDILFFIFLLIVALFFLGYFFVTRLTFRKAERVYLEGYYAYRTKNVCEYSTESKERDFWYIGKEYAELESKNCQ